MRITRSTGVEQDVDQLDWELEKLNTLKIKHADLSTAIENQNGIVALLFDQRGQKSRAHGGYRYTLVRAERTKINELGLKKAIGARAFNKLTTAKVDPAKVKTAVEEGTLDPVILGQHAENVLNKPSVRISKADESDGE